MSDPQQMVKDRLWQMKKAAGEIIQLCNDNKITCESCQVIYYCGNIADLADMEID